MILKFTLKAKVSETKRFLSQIGEDLARTKKEVDQIEVIGVENAENGVNEIVWGSTALAETNQFENEFQVLSE